MNEKNLLSFKKSNKIKEFSLHTPSIEKRSEEKNLQILTPFQTPILKQNNCNVLKNKNASKIKQKLLDNVKNISLTKSVKIDFQLQKITDFKEIFFNKSIYEDMHTIKRSNCLFFNKEKIKQNPKLYKKIKKYNEKTEIKIKNHNLDKIFFYDFEYYQICRECINSANNSEKSKI